MNNTIIIILGMMLVTYIPRMLPFHILANRKLPKKLELFLKSIPCAALGALIIPGVFDSIPQRPVAGVVGFFVAVVLSWLRGGIIIPVLGSVISVLFILVTIGI